MRLEIGTREVAEQARPEHRAGEPLKLLFAGRFLYWKGMHLGLEGLSPRCSSRGVEARLTMLGRGPEEAAWRQLAAELGVDHAIDWLAWVEHERDRRALPRATTRCCYPSLHDSSGNVVLEALNHGLPVVCLDLGGPAEMVNPAAAG